jgi:hypothetical protein
MLTNCCLRGFDCIVENNPFTCNDYAIFTELIQKISKYLSKR